MRISRLFLVVFAFCLAGFITGCFGKKTEIVEIEKPIIIEKPVEPTPQTCFVVECSAKQKVTDTPYCLRDGSYYWNHFKMRVVKDPNKRWNGPEDVTFASLAKQGFFYDNKGVWFEPFVVLDGVPYGPSFINVCGDVRRGP